MSDASLELGISLNTYLQRYTFPPIIPMFGTLNVSLISQPYQNFFLILQDQHALHGVLYIIDDVIDYTVCSDFNLPRHLLSPELRSLALR